ncbi:hypothetical protein ANN_07467 [Periplaneta americana]|uniref:Uncharacterized protein n=1 Tax=Periplaneta americana TaxID=6978 RepID=A0ABQ8SYS8_PERAM|nr:hypothetical protein ANN_07467 [Periplaneta americana]
MDYKKLEAALEVFKMGSDRKYDIAWKIAIGTALVHVAGLYGLYYSLLNAKFVTMFYGSTLKKKSSGRNSIALRLSEATVRSRALRLLSLGPFEGSPPRYRPGNITPFYYSNTKDLEKIYGELLAFALLPDDQ